MQVTRFWSQKHVGERFEHNIRTLQEVQEHKLPVSWSKMNTIVTRREYKACKIRSRELRKAKMEVHNAL